MNIVKKILNVFGIILAWFLSIALILMLVVSPMVLSLLSLLDAQTITKALTSGLTGPSAYVQEEEGPHITKLSNTESGNLDTSQVDQGLLDSIMGSTGMDQETLNKLLSSNVAQELIEAYTNDMTNAITGGGGEVQFNAEKVKQIVNDNMDEIVEVLQEVSPEFADKSADEIKQQIGKLIDENVDELIAAVPKPEDIKNQIAQSNPELETALEIIAMKDTIKAAIVGAIVALSVLIFLCRIPGFRGFRWLATILFIGGGLNAVMSVGLLLSSSLVGSLTAANPALAGIVTAILSSFTTGMLIRTAVMIVSAVVLLVVYIIIKKARKKKLAALQAAEETVAEETAEITEEAAEALPEETVAAVAGEESADK